MRWNASAATRALVFVAVLGAPVSALSEGRAATDEGFRTWLEGQVWPLAQAEGVSRELFASAFEGVSLELELPGLILPGADVQASAPRRQAEFGAPARYFRPSSLEAIASHGRRMAERHQGILARIEEETGVPGRVVLAIWGRESGFGRVAVNHDVFAVLGTRAYFSSGEYLTRELVGALQIAEAGHVPLARMTSSWAGALGQPQMMPRSFLAYAVDGDGDAHADIWSSEADTLASIANFLAVHDWVPGRDWGFEVRVPDTVSCALEGPDRGRSIADWEALGITRISGRPFPAKERESEGFLLMPAGRHGPAFIVTPNFYVLKRYNRSDLYALFIGNAGDRIQYGMGDFKAGWDDLGTLLRSEIATIQEGLEALGHDVGGVDGLPGYKTRRAIGAWQEAAGRRATCFPEPGMAAALGG